MLHEEAHGSSKKSAKHKAAAYLLERVNNDAAIQNYLNNSIPKDKTNSIGELKNLAALCSVDVYFEYEEFSMTNFKCKASFGDMLNDEGHGSTKKAAKHMAATNLLNRVNNDVEIQNLLNSIPKEKFKKPTSKPRIFNKINNSTFKSALSLLDPNLDYASLTSDFFLELMNDHKIEYKISTESKFLIRDIYRSLCRFFLFLINYS